MRQSLLTSLAFAAGLALTASADTQPPTTIGLGDCKKHWAEAVVATTGPVSDAEYALGDTANDFARLDAGGCIVLTFGGAFTQDGSPFSDIGIDEFGATDCYEIALRPSNAATIAAIVQDGWAPAGGGFYKPAGLIECGDQNWDIDFYAPGNAAASLSFDALRLCNLVGVNPDVEIARAWAQYVCPCLGATADVQSTPCGFSPFDPILSADPFEILTAPKVYLDTPFAGVTGWIYWSKVPANTFVVNGCTFNIDLFSLNILDQFLTDLNGDHVAQAPFLQSSLIGVEVAFLARVCSPDISIPGPLAPLPDFFSNTLVVRVGCPD